MLKKLIEKQLAKHILLTTYQEFQSTLEYSTLPAGKLFRPLLGASIHQDLVGAEKTYKELQDSHSNLTLFLTSLEIHHAYTLVHDDLPCMDDDNFRRGRESVHKKFGQWSAVLAGDSLLHQSHYLVSQVSHKHERDLRKFFSWFLGAKGLILGQVYDLGGEIKKDFISLMRTHELKTARLIQLSICGTALLSQDKYSYQDHINYMRIGRSIGLLFQLLDDLSECTEELSTHERDVSPFIRFPKQSLSLTRELINNLDTGLVGRPYTNKFLRKYLSSMQSKILPSVKDNESILIKNLGKQFVQIELLPVMNLL